MSNHYQHYFQIAYQGPCLNKPHANAPDYEGQLSMTEGDLIPSDVVGTGQMHPIHISQIITSTVGPTPGNFFQISASNISNVIQPLAPLAPPTGPQIRNSVLPQLRI